MIGVPIDAEGPLIPNFQEPPGPIEKYGRWMSARPPIDIRIAQLAPDPLCRWRVSLFID